jgi:hypothetical protein
VALSGTVFLAGWVAGWLACFVSPGIENTYAAPIEDRGAPRGATSVTVNGEPVDAPQATAMASVANVATAVLVPLELAVAPATMSVGEAATVDPDPPKPAFVLAGVSAVEVPVVAAALSDSHPTPPEKRMQFVSLFTSDPAKEDLKPAPRRVEILHECLVAEICIDEYLWALYDRTPKVDTNKVTERIKTTVKRKGKMRTVIKTITKYVVGDFTWKDPIAAQRAGMSLKDYVIGGMDRGFKLKLFRAVCAMEDAGLMPGITSAFRDDFRQSIAVGNKAASDSSYHGGSRRGGYGHGLAADLVSVKGETRMQRYASSAELWKWIDANEKELGIGRPYLDRDPPHVAPIDGKEYSAKRSRPNVQRAGLQAKKALAAKLVAKTRQVDVRNDPGTKRRAEQAKTSKVRSVQKSRGATTTRQAGARNNLGATTRDKPAKSSKVSSLQNRASVQR